MNERPEIRLDKAQFLRWVQDQDGRFELKGGKVLMQAGGTRRHGWVIGAFVSVLRLALDPETWAVSPTEIAVEIGADIRYPDVLVERRDGDASALSTAHPVILVEVTSSSSSARDFIEKLAEYTSLPSLEAYIVASQDEPICWVWQRGADGAFPRLPEEAKGRDSSVVLTARGISLPLGELYRGIGT